MSIKERTQNKKTWTARADSEPLKFATALVSATQQTEGAKFRLSSIISTINPSADDLPKSLPAFSNLDTIAKAANQNPDNEDKDFFRQEIDSFTGNKTVDTLKGCSNFCVLDPLLLSYLINNETYTPTKFAIKLSEFYNDVESAINKFLNCQ